MPIFIVALAMPMVLTNSPILAFWCYEEQVGRG